MDQDPNERYDEGVAAAKAWRDEERAKFDVSTSTGNWLLRAIAAESDGRLRELAPGCFVESTLDLPPV